LGKDDKRLILNIGSAFLIKGFALLISFISLPAYIKYFNDDMILGLWFTILSVLTWVLTFDFGIGNGLRNNIVKPLQEKNIKEVKEYISSAYIILGILTILIAILVMPVIILLDWNKVFNISESIVDNSLLVKVVLINMLTILLQFFIRIINSIIYALNKSAINNLLALITAVSQLLFVLIYKSDNTNSSLIILSVVHLLCVVVPLLLASIYIFSKDLKGMLPEINYYKKDKAKMVLFNGAAIFINQILYLFLTATNAFIISYLISPSQVVEYQIYYRIFILSGSLYMLALTPLWSAVTTAHVERKYNWINKYFNLMLLGALLISLFQLVAILLLQTVFNIWLGTDAPTVNYIWAAIFAVFGGIFTLQSTVSTFAMGFNKTKLQAIMYGFAVILKIILVLVLTQYYQIWIIVVFADLVVFVPYVIVEYFDLKKVIKHNSILFGNEV
jgi:O-antigen/teichoic acid export membrane protein